MNTFPLVPIGLLVLWSAIFSSSETALFSLSRFQLRQLRQKSPKNFQKIRHLLDRPTALVATVLLGNECANVLISNMLTRYYQRTGLSSIAVTVINLLTAVPIILILGEITPKVLAAKTNMFSSQLLLKPFWFFYKLSFPARFLLESVVNLLTRGFRGKVKNDDQIREDDIRHLLEDGKRKGAFHSLEQDMIENVFEIDDDTVMEIATPLSECFTVRQDAALNTVLERLKKDFASRIPVKGHEQDKIVGILYAKDLLSRINAQNTDMSAKDLMKEPFFVEPEMKIEALFRRFRHLKRHIAVVRAKNGKALGIVTMEDILDHTFGELWEEEE